MLFATHAMPATSGVASSAKTSPATVQPASTMPEDLRVIYTNPSPAHSAKNHLNLPPRLPFYPAGAVAVSPSGGRTGPTAIGEPQLNVRTEPMMNDDSRTALNGCYVKAVLNVRLLFGAPHQIDARRRRDDPLLVLARPVLRVHLVGATVRAPAGRGIRRRRGAGSRQGGHRLPCVDRAVQVHAFLHCRCVGKQRGVVGRADELIRQIQRNDIDPCRVPPVYFRLASQAIRVGREPRRIDPTELQCFLKEQGHAS